MLSQHACLQSTLRVELTQMRHRLPNNAPADAHAAHQTPITVDLAGLLANRVAQLHAPSQSPPKRKRNTQGRHYMLKPPSHTGQGLDSTQTPSRKIAKTIPELRKLG